MIITSNNEAQTLKFAAKLGKICVNYQNVIIYLVGNLGAGKTTFARGFIGCFGFKKVKSPTYSIVESYITNNTKIHHFDLYRITDSEELEHIGVREYLNDICLIEWPEFGSGVIPNADITVNLSLGNNKTINLVANTNRGQEILEQC
jgi:tRNA threonylcarbamoyladenosine biosynthesis protein TsaE